MATSNIPIDVYKNGNVYSMQELDEISLAIGELKAEQRNTNQKLSDVATSLKAVADNLAALPHSTYYNDIETRVRSLESARWKFTGFVTALAAAGATILNWIMSKIGIVWGA